MVWYVAETWRATVSAAVNTQTNVGQRLRNSVEEFEKLC